jgi:Fe-S-cluster containining protein
VSASAIPVDDKCSRCHGSTCCTYATEALGTLRAKADFDHLLWQVSHDNIEAYRDDSGWYLLIRGSCEHLAADGSCRIYARRPQVCRDYSNDWCEFDEPAERHFRHHFRNYHELLAYCRKRFRRWDG